MTIVSHNHSSPTPLAASASSRKLLKPSVDLIRTTVLAGLAGGTMDSTSPHARAAAAMRSSFVFGAEPEAEAGAADMGESKDVKDGKELIVTAWEHRVELLLEDLLMRLHFGAHFLSKATGKSALAASDEEPGMQSIFSKLKLKNKEEKRQQKAVEAAVAASAAAAATATTHTHTYRGSDAPPPLEIKRKVEASGPGKDANGTNTKAGEDPAVAATRAEQLAREQKRAAEKLRLQQLREKEEDETAEMNVIALMLTVLRLVRRVLLLPFEELVSSPPPYPLTSFFCLSAPPPQPYPVSL
jgi:hypothetical protein